MSFNTTNFISKSLSLTDANITFSGEVFEKVINSRSTLVYNAKLTYNAKSCPCCRNLNSSSIIKYGSKQAFVRLLPINGQPAALSLKKQRFSCK